VDVSYGSIFPVVFHEGVVLSESFRGLVCALSS